MNCNRHWPGRQAVNFRIFLKAIASAMEETNPTGPGLSRRKFLRQAAILSSFVIVPRYVLGGKGYTAPSDKIRLGFIGCGRQGFGLKNSFLKTEGAQIVAACDVYASKLQQFAQEVQAAYAARAGQSAYQGCTTYADFGELLRNADIDAVVIATPDHWHGVQAVRAAEAGKDIYCEKPLSLTIAEGRAMVAAARRHKRVFQTGSMQRSWPEFRQAVELVRNGYIGQVKNIKVSVGGPPRPYDLPEEPLPGGLDWKRWLGPNAHRHYNHQLNPSLKDTFWGRWRDYEEFGGGGMTDWGAHMFDIAQWALDMDDSGPVSITPPDGKEHPFLTYRYGNGIVMTHENFGKNNAVLFTGTEGTVEIQRGKLTTTPEALRDKVIGPREKRVYYSDNHYTDFLNAVKKRSRPVCDVETGHRTASVCTLGNIAYALKRPLQWDPKRETFRNDREANLRLSRKMANGFSLEP